MNYMLVSEAETLVRMIQESDATQILEKLEDIRKITARLQLLIEEHKLTENQVNG